MTLGVLASYAQERGATNMTRYRTLADAGVPFVWDSGAFSVASGTATVDLDEHTAWVIANDQPGVRFLALDVIGDPEATLANYAAQRATGARVEPTVHYGDPVAQVDRLLAAADPPEWVNVGGVVAALSRKSSYRNVAAFLAAVRRRLPAATKIHALGCTPPRIARLVAFEGVDSTYWLSVSRFRSLSLFDRERGDWRKFSACSTTSDPRRHHTWATAYAAGSWLRSEYDLTPDQVAREPDDAAMVRAAVLSHLRFGDWIAQLHGIDCAVYLAGALSVTTVHDLLTRTTT